MKRKIIIFGLLLACMLAASHVAFATAETNDKIYETLSTELKSNFLNDNPELDIKTRMMALDIDQEAVKNISSENLVCLCLENPFSSLIVTANNPVAWLDDFAESFGPFRELLIRSDVVDTVEGVRTAGVFKERKLAVYDEEFLDAILLKLNKEERLPENSILRFIDEGQRLSVYTPKGTAVTVIKRGEQLTATQKTQINNQMASLYPNATRLASATTHYNCHSYAWYSNSTNNKYWMNNPSAYMSDTSYISVGSSFSGLHECIIRESTQHSALQETQKLFQNGVKLDYINMRLHIAHILIHVPIGSSIQI